MTIKRLSLAQGIFHAFQKANLHKVGKLMFSFNGRACCDIDIGLA